MVIYKITNVLNNKSYIGQTAQKNPLLRIKRHFQNGKPKNKSLIWEAIKKHGRDNFTIEILFSTSDNTELNKKEQQLILEYKSLCPHGYNLQTGGQSDYKFTDEVKLRISSSLKGHTYMKGIRKTIEHRKAMSKSRKGFTSPARIASVQKNAIKLRKAVRATNIKTLETQVFKSIEDASCQLKVPACNISRVCNKMQNRSQAGGYKFEFVNK